MNNKRLTESEIELLNSSIYELFGNFLENDPYEEISKINISDIYYLSCMTEISYHKLFSYLMYEYTNSNLVRKRENI